MAGNTLASLMTKIKVDTSGVDRSFKLIKGGLSDADKKLNAFKTAVANSTREMSQAKIALDVYKQGLKQSGDKSTEAKAKLDQLTNAYKNSQIALANNRLELQKYQTEMAISSGQVSKFAGALSLIKIGAITAVVAGLSALTVGATKTAASFEQLFLSFEVLVGNADKAKAFTNELINLANVTPMTTEGLAQNAKLLLAMGESLENVIPDLKMLGDISGGSQEKLNSLALVFGQIGARGRLTGDNLKQLQEAGFDPLNIIAQKTGETMSQVRDRMERGDIAFSEFRDTLVTVTSEGGRFFGMMDKQSQTLNGRLSTMADIWQLVSNSIGQLFLPVAKKAVDVLIALGDWTLRLSNKLVQLSDHPLQRAIIGLKKLVGIAPKNTGMVFEFKSKGAEKVLQQKQNIQSGFVDSTKEPTQKASRSSGGSTADQIISERRQAIQVQSEFEIAQANMVESAKLKKQLETQQRITALYKQGSIEYTQSKTDELQITNRINELKLKSEQKLQAEKDKIQKEAKDKEIKAAEDVADSISGALKSAVNGTQTLREAFRNMLVNMAADIVKSGIKKQLTNLFQGYGSGGGGVISGFLTSVNPALGGFAKMFGFANGGFPDTSKPFIAGERGAELIVPSNKTKVFTNKETQGILGGSGDGTQAQTIQPVLVTNTFKVETMQGDNAVRTLSTPESKAVIQKIIRDAVKLNQGGVRNEVKNVK